MRHAATLGSVIQVKIPEKLITNSLASVLPSSLLVGVSHQLQTSATTLVTACEAFRIGVKRGTYAVLVDASRGVEYFGVFVVCVLVCGCVCLLCVFFVVFVVCVCGKGNARSLRS